MNTNFISPIDVAISPTVIFGSTKLCYDHDKQQSYSSEINDGMIKSELMATSTQTFRNNGTPYDSDND